MTKEVNPAASPSRLVEVRPIKSLDELIAEQGVGQTATFEHLLGRGADLWADEAEFGTFLEHLRTIRQEKG